MSLPVASNAILSVRHYSVTPPDNLVIPVEEVIPLSRDEEVVTKKKTELTTTRQIQTRVKRQVVLEDGKVVEDSGPIVTTNTTEDTEKHEEQNTEHINLGDGNKEAIDEVDRGKTSLVEETREKKIKSREEKEERLETEQVVNLGDISDELYLKAIQSNRTKDLKHISSSNALVQRLPPKIVHQSAKVKKTVDTEDSKHLKKLAGDGRILTESETTVQHEVINDSQEPCQEEVSDHESVHETSFQYNKTKEQEIETLLENGKKIAEKVVFQGENFTGGGSANPESLLNIEQPKWETLSERIRKLKKNANNTTTTKSEDRPDAVTQQPLDFHQEERSRRVETSKWLDNHFGSESSASSKNSVENGPTSNNSRTTSFINVTMKSAPPTKSVSPSKLFSPKETTIVTQTSPYYHRGITEWTDTSSDLVKDNNTLSSTSEWKKETDTSSEWRKVSEHRNTSLLSDGSEVKKSSLEEHTRVNRVIPIQLYRTNSIQDVTTSNSISYKPEITTGSLSSLPIYAEVNKKKTRFAPETRSISQNPDPTDSREHYVKRIPIMQNNSVANNSNHHHQNGNTVKRKNSTKRTSLTESFKKFMDKLRNGSKKKSQDSVDKSKENDEPIVPPRAKHRTKTRVNKFYLGEDPYGSMYGKEKEYDSVTVYRDRPKVGGSTLPRRHNHSNAGDFDTVTVYKRKEPNTILVNSRGGVQTLPRKSTTAVYNYNTNSNNPNDSDFETVTVYRSRGNSHSDHQHVAKKDRGGIQTLPRKNKVKHTDQMSTTSNNSTNSNINVFIVNKRSPFTSTTTSPPPAKPSRTYRTNLLRSQSFNVQPNIYPSTNLYKSNPHLEILEEDVAPLKSPSIINSVSKNNLRYQTSLRS